MTTAHRQLIRLLPPVCFIFVLFCLATCATPVPEGDVIAVTNEGEPLPTATVAGVTPVMEQVAIAGADGLTLMGDFQSDGTTAQPAVLLLHMLNNRRQSWQPLIPDLLAAGYAVLAIDMRGHGATGSAMEWTLAEQDLQLVFDWLQARPEVKADQVLMIGASIGANMALRTAANDSEAAGVVMLSGGLDYLGVTADDALSAYAQKQVLIIAAEGDRYAANSAEILHAQQSNTQLVIYSGSAHGTSLLTTQPDIIPNLLDWLNQTISRN